MVYLGLLGIEVAEMERTWASPRGCRKSAGPNAEDQPSDIVKLIQCTMSPKKIGLLKVAVLNGGSHDICTASGVCADIWSSQLLWYCTDWITLRPSVEAAMGKRDLQSLLRGPSRATHMPFAHPYA